MSDHQCVMPIVGAGDSQLHHQQAEIQRLRAAMAGLENELATLKVLVEKYRDMANWYAAELKKRMAI